MRWCGSRTLDHGTANRVFSRANPLYSKARDLFRIPVSSTGEFHEIFVMIQPIYEFNKLPLSPPRFRRTLIIFSQLITRICYIKLILMSQLPRHGAVGSWEDSSKCSAPGVVSAQSVLSIGVQFLFVLLRSRGVLCQNERAGIFKFKLLKEKTSTRAQRGALSLHWFVSFFRVTSLHLHVLLNKTC